MKKGLDGYFIKYGITEEDLAIINQACNAMDINSDWFQEEILAKLQELKNNSNGTIGESAINKIVSNAVEQY